MMHMNKSACLCVRACVPSIAQQRHHHRSTHLFYNIKPKEGARINISNFFSFTEKQYIFESKTV